MIKLTRKEADFISAGGRLLLVRSSPDLVEGKNWQILVIKKDQGIVLVFPDSNSGYRTAEHALNFAETFEHLSLDSPMVSVHGKQNGKKVILQ